MAYPFLKEKKWIKYYSLAAVAFLFHSSAIIIFTFPLFRNIRIDKRSIGLLIIGFVILNAILNYFPTLIQTILFSERLSNRFETYSEFKTDINGMLNIFFYYAFLPYLVVALNNKIRRRKQLFEELHMLYFVLVMIVVSISGFARMLNYLTPFMIIYFADFLNTLYQRRTFSQLSGQVVFLILLVSTIPKIRYYSADTSKFYNGTHRYNLYYPYTSIFNKEEYRFRDIIFREGQKESLNRD
ncbi:EpsG family protein [Pedobacter panaciterrae]|nr:EpsG family protein [Pedobacter panaciterrae]